MVADRSPRVPYRTARRFAACLWCCTLLALTPIHTNAADKVQALPETMTEDIVMTHVSLFGSSSPSAHAISVEHPRVISYGLDARFVVTWTTNPQDPAFHHVEFLQHAPEHRRWIAGAIDFSGPQPELRHPQACARCHSAINRPLWGGEEWLGAERRAWTVFPKPGTDEYDRHEAMLHSTNPRLTPLELKAYRARPRHVDQGSRGFGTDPSAELGRLLIFRHAETLFRILRDTLQDTEIASELCHVPAHFSSGPHSSHAGDAIRALFDQERYNIGRLADTLEFFAAITGPNDRRNPTNIIHPARRSPVPSSS